MHLGLLCAEQKRHLQIHSSSQSAKSLVGGYGLPPHDSFRAQLERRLRSTLPRTQIISAGVSGNTGAGVLKREFGLLALLLGRPSLVIVQVGPNDGLRQLTPAAVRASLDEILMQLERCEIPVLLTTVEPPVILRERAAAYLGTHEELATCDGAGGDGAVLPARGTWKSGDGACRLHASEQRRDQRGCRYHVAAFGEAAEPGLMHQALVDEALMDAGLVLV